MNESTTDPLRVRPVDADAPVAAAPAIVGGATAAPAGARAMGDVVVRGAAWTSIAWGVGTVASFGAQYVLGLKLSKEDFARLGIIMTIGGLGLTFADGGMRKILVSRPAEIGTLGWPAFVVSLTLNSIVAIGLLAFAHFAAPAYFGRSDLTPLVALFSVMIVVGSFGVTQSARLSIDQRFKWIAGVVAVGNVARHAMAVGLALLGAGVYAYVVPMASIVFFNLAASVYQVGWTARRPAPAHVYRGLLRETFWIQLAAFAAMLTMTGDYWVGGRELSAAQFGVYYFGFQLAQSLTGAASSVLQAVLTPTFALLRADAGRRRSAIRTSNALTSATLMLATLGGVMAAPLLIHAVWRGKWDAAIFVVQAVMPLLWSRSLATIGQSVLDAGAHWVASLVATLAYAATLLLGAILGLWLGGFGGFVLGVVLAHTASTLGISLYACGLTGCAAGEWAADVLLPLAVAAACFVAYAGATVGAGQTLAAPWWSAASAVVVAGAYVATLSWLSPSHAGQLASLARRVLRRPSATPAA